MIVIFLLVATSAYASFLPEASSSYVPEQIHLSYGETEDSMYVTWSTPTVASKPYVQFALNQTGSPTVTVQAGTRTFGNSDWNIAPNVSLFVYFAKMTGLKLGQFYTYQVGSSKGMSSSYVFRAKRDFSKGEDQPKLVFYGDLGVGPEQTLTINTLKKQTAKYLYDAIFQMGDYAYNMNSNSGNTGNQFFNDIQPIASIIPYMGVQGNHEGMQFSCTSHWINRFTMPGNNSNMWYSMDFGLVHVIAISTELTFYADPLQADQYAWVEQELKNVDRAKTPWVVVTAHRPTYCSINTGSSDGYEDDQPGPFTTRIKDCTQSAPIIRDAFEELFYKYKVDIFLAAHVHTYERLNPAYQNHTMPSAYASKNTIRGASSYLVIVSGMAGQQESYAKLSTTPLPWSVAQSDAKGVGLLTPVNKTAILWQQLSSTDLSVIDYLWLLK